MTNRDFAQEIEIQLVAGLVILFFSTVVTAGAPEHVQASFDCQTAMTKVEKAICSDQTLAAKDVALAQAYRKALDGIQEKDAFRKEQQQWLKARGSCANADARCLTQLYDARLRELQGRNMATKTGEEKPTAEHCLQQGHALMHKGRLQEALKLYEEALRIEPGYKPAILSIQHVNEKLETSEWLKQNVSEECRKDSKNFDQKMKCVDEAFVLNGAPINAKIVEELSTLLSDHNDQVISIDLSNSQDSNRFYCQESKVKDRTVSCISKVDKNITQEFSYTYLGRSKTGIHILKTVSSDSLGSGIFVSLMLVRIEKGNSLVLNSKKLFPQQRLLITKLTEIPLGDRPSGEAVYKDDKVVIREGGNEEVLLAF